MTALERLRSRISRPVRIVFPDGEDERVIQAAFRLAGAGVARPIVLAPAVAAPPGIEVVDPKVSAARLRYEERCAAAKSLSAPMAHRLLDRPHYFALMMLHEGAADAMLLGAHTSTGEALVACRSIFPSTRPEPASSVFAIDAAGLRPEPDDLLLFADCAVNPSPSAEDLASIAEGAASLGTTLLAAEPRVAMLSFSTHGSANHPDAEKVARATALVRHRHPSMRIDGELQADAALDPAAVGHKLDAAGEVAGRANVLVFPDLDAGNISYKLVRTLARARAYGVFLQGFGHPIAKISRGADPDEIFGTGLILSALAQRG